MYYLLTDSFQTQGRQNTSVLARILQEVEENKHCNIAEEHLLAMNMCFTACVAAADTVGASAATSTRAER